MSFERTFLRGLLAFFIALGPFLLTPAAASAATGDWSMSEDDGSSDDGSSDDPPPPPQPGIGVPELDPAEGTGAIALLLLCLVAAFDRRLGQA